MELKTIVLEQKDIIPEPPAAFDASKARPSENALESKNEESKEEEHQIIPKLQWGNIKKKWKTCATLFVLFSLLVAGIGFLTNVYVGRGFTREDRPAMFFLYVCWVVVLWLMYNIGKLIVKSITGKIKVNLFEPYFLRRSEDKTRLFNLCDSAGEILDSTGRYYLLRLYGLEIFESLYQVFNFGLYACIMPAQWLLPYCVVMLVASSFQLYFVRKVKEPIDNRNKEIENKIDICLEFFCCAYPLAVGYFGFKIYFTDWEVIQIAAVPLYAYASKLYTLIHTEVLIELNNNREMEEEEKRRNDFLELRRRKRRPSYEMKRRNSKERRRSSLEQKEEALKKLQNSHFGLPWRYGLNFFFSFFILFYFTMGVFQILSLSATTPEHFDTYCFANVRSCKSWVLPEDNCLIINHLYMNGTNSDRILKEFSESNAAMIVRVSDLQDFKLLKSYSKLRRLEVFKSNATNFNIDLNAFTGLNSLYLSGFPHLKQADDSFFSNKINKVFYSDIPNLIVEDFSFPYTTQLELIRVGVRLKRVHAPVASTLSLVNYGLTKFPDGEFSKKFYLLKLSKNNFTKAPIDTSKMQGTLVVLDYRYNLFEQLPAADASYSYGAGNPSKCSKGWKCDDFCDSKCTNFEHTTVTYIGCNYDCVLYCGRGKCINFND